MRISEEERRFLQESWLPIYTLVLIGVFLIALVSKNAEVLGRESVKKREVRTQISQTVYSSQGIHYPETVELRQEAAAAIVASVAPSQFEALDSWKLTQMYDLVVGYGDRSKVEVNQWVDQAWKVLEAYETRRRAYADSLMRTSSSKSNGR